MFGSDKSSRIGILASLLVKSCVKLHLKLSIFIYLSGSDNFLSTLQIVFKMSFRIQEHSESIESVLLEHL